MNNASHLTSSIPAADMIPEITTLEPGCEIIHHYFPNLSTEQSKQLHQLGTLYATWNQRINLISRQDLPNLYLRHVLHALSIAKVIAFKPNTHILDVGTGGGFPGIPLAILFPETAFHLVDSIAKKIHAVQAIAESLHLPNVTTQVIRAETLPDKYDFILGRAVTQLDTFCRWMKDKVAQQSFNTLTNGILYLKGDEPIRITQAHDMYPLTKVIDHPFFATKQLVHIY